MSSVAATITNIHFSSSDTDSDSSSLRRHHHADLSTSIFKSYNSNESSNDLTKIQTLLTTSSSGALSCLICLERIKPSDPTWSCRVLCHALFHLICIQSWSRQSSSLSASRAASLLPISQSRAVESSSWNCPKCRSPYSHSQIPKSYFCFCGKLENPPSDNPWILPHSCGEICNRPLVNDCGHYCLLLCHPGPCPPCPQLVKSSCFCGRVEDVRRCGNKVFSCNSVCNKLLDCKRHNCVEKCHDGDCPPCQMRGVYRCLCGKEEMERECCEREFRCENECGKGLGCGKHLCERGCHEGKCGGCPYQGKRSCPCGKKFYDGLDCDVAVPLCGASCDKVLSCGLHRCPERCHRGKCNETCRIVLTKSCRCGGLKKQIWFAKGDARG